MNLTSKITIFALILIHVTQIIAPPVNQKKNEDRHPTDENDELLDLEYSQYLQQVVQLLEEDSGFKNKLQNATQEEIMSGGIAKELAFVSHGVRSKLDEVKRMEIDRLRSIVRQKEELSHGVWSNILGDLGIDRKQAKISNHLNDQNHMTFEIEDLKRLIVQATKDIAVADEKRRKKFKEYEMEKERDREEKFDHLDKEQRAKAEEEYQLQVKKHKDHPKLHHPGTKDQFKEVWEKEDQLPGDEFNLKTFFRMHDFDNDGKWSIDEVNAIFHTELKKMYDANATEDDMNERMEEMQRMREHMFKESDVDRDDMISFKEFEEYSKRPEYNEDPGWTGLDEQQLYTRDEYEEYAKQRQEELARMDAAARNYWDSPPYYPPGVHPGGMMPPMPPQGYPHQGNYPQEYQQPGMHQQYPQQQQQQQHPGMQQPYQHQQHPGIQQPYQQQQQPQPGMHQQQQFQQQPGMHQQQQFQQHQAQFQQQPNVPASQQNLHVPPQQVPIQQVPVQQPPQPNPQQPIQQQQPNQQRSQQVPVPEQKKADLETNNI